MASSSFTSSQAANMQRLRNLVLPTDLFGLGFCERDAVAKQRELALLAEYERWWRSGEWDHLTLPFQEIIDRWRAEIANPLHFASIGPNPRWVPVMTASGSERRRHSSGGYRKSWREYRRKQIAKKREAQGKPPSKHRF